MGKGSPQSHDSMNKATLLKIWTQHRMWMLVFVASVITLLGIMYVGSYVYLSRRGMQEAAPFRIKGFLYIPLTEAINAQEMSRHYQRKIFCTGQCC